MLVPTSVTTRLTSRLAVSLPTLGPPSPLHRDACSIVKTVMNPFTSKPGLHPAEQGERNNVGSNRGETIRPVRPLGLRRRPATPSGARGPSREVRSGLSRPHRPLRGPRGKSPNGRSRGTADHVQPPEPDAELVAGHPRLCHLQQGRSDAQPVSDAEGPLVETFRREILAERSPRKVGLPEFAPPEGIVFTRVGVDSLRGACMDGRVRLAVADEAGSPDPDAAPHGLLEDRRRDFAACHSTVFGRETFTETTRMARSEEHTSELQSRSDLVCRLLLEKKNNAYMRISDHQK